MRSSQQSLLFAIIVLLFIACGKDTEVFTPFEPTGEVDEFYQNTQDPTTRSYQSLAEEHILVFTDNGCVLEIPQNSLIDENGNLVQGGINIEIIEIFEKGDMILHNTPTITDNEYLISGGMFYINATKDGRPLKLKDGKQYNFFVPTEEPDFDMQLFFGEENSDGTLIWQEAEEDANANLRVTEWAFQTDTGAFNDDFGYVFSTDKFTWVNIDKYDDVPDDQKTSVCVKLAEELYNAKNTIVFMVYKNELAVIPFVYKEEDKLFCEPYSKVPIGWEVYLVAISSQGDDIYHFGIIEREIVRNSVFRLALSETSLEDIIAKLEGL